MDNVSPFQYFIGALKKYLVFKGRARRAEYWFFSLFVLIISIFVGILDIMFDLFITDDTTLLNSLFRLAIFLPTLSVTVRRMHDCDKNGWFMFIPIYSIYLCFTKGTEGPNRYGPDPIEENQTDINQSSF